ncbi:hypothetical protein MA16_Dca002125 [Dendrobium catenatum]|uniref:Uncharacterized protein n=1 Tax=Dendrobium catenatum TaxID=906689 RepID=A0A2I0XEH7_9ASPA|nr:hypothetical protein MA16_Dca002125 [Dendrobium catenatum]
MEAKNRASGDCGVVMRSQTIKTYLQNSEEGCKSGTGKRGQRRTGNLFGSSRRHEDEGCRL